MERNKKDKAGVLDTVAELFDLPADCLLYTSPSPRDTR